MDERCSTVLQSVEEQSILRLELSDVRDAINRMKAGYGKYFVPATTNSTGCLLATKTPNKGEKTGWVKCKVGGQRTEYYIHHLALIVANRQDELRGLIDGKQVSHLCHNRCCFKASHLIVEDAEDNRGRNRCRGWTWITCPCGCDHKFNLCPHNPQCILPQ